jgi:hypothetical protein
MSSQIIYIFYPETKGKTLEEMDGLFGKVTVDSSGSAERGDIAEGKQGYESPKVEEVLLKGDEGV